MLRIGQALKHLSEPAEDIVAARRGVAPLRSAAPRVASHETATPPHAAPAAAGWTPGGPSPSASPALNLHRIPQDAVIRGSTVTSRENAAFVLLVRGLGRRCSMLAFGARTARLRHSLTLDAACQEEDVEWPLKSVHALAQAWLCSPQFSRAYFKARARVPVGAVEVLVVYPTGELSRATTRPLVCGQPCDWPGGVAAKVRSRAAHVAALLFVNDVPRDYFDDFGRPRTPVVDYVGNEPVYDGEQPHGTPQGTGALDLLAATPPSAAQPPQQKPDSVGPYLPPWRRKQQAAAAAAAAAAAGGDVIGGSTRRASVDLSPVRSDSPEVDRASLRVAVPMPSPPAIEVAREESGDVGHGGPTATGGAGASSAVMKSPEIRPVRRNLSMMAPGMLTDGLEFGVCGEQGERRSMEDVHVVVHDLEKATREWDAVRAAAGLTSPKINPAASERGMITRFAAVYDGHDGRAAAEFVGERLHHEIVHSRYFPQQLDEAVRDAFRVTERKLLEEAAAEGFESGTTAVVVLLQGDRLVVGHVGDSRAVMSRAGRALALTRDHSPDDPDELKRIEREGGFVRDGMVDHLLGVARSLGDWDIGNSAKIKGVSAEPDVVEMMLRDDDEFLLLACDGLWEKFSNKGAVRFVRNSLQRGQSAEEGARMVVHEALRRATTDNVSAIVIGFHNRPGFEWGGSDKSPSVSGAPLRSSHRGGRGKVPPSPDFAAISPVRRSISIGGATSGASASPTSPPGRTAFPTGAAMPHLSLSGTDDAASPERLDPVVPGAENRTVVHPDSVVDAHVAAGGRRSPSGRPIFAWSRLGKDIGGKSDDP